MSDHVNSEKQRLLDLLSDRALFGLSAEEARELATLAAAHPDVDGGEMDRIVGLLEASSPATEQRAMPAEVQAGIQESIVKASGAKRGTEPATTEPVTSASKQRDASSKNRMTWLRVAVATAASLLVAFSLANWLGNSRTLSIAAQKKQLENTANDLVQADWTVNAAWKPTQNKPYSGEVVWSNESQTGFMTFNGLPINDNTKSQYQLWIFDKEQDERHPIDGGVFDVTGESVTVPIDAKIRVQKPYMFAITVEKPGGVVVSSRLRLPLIAEL